MQPADIEAMVADEPLREERWRLPDLEVRPLGGEQQPLDELAS